MSAAAPQFWKTPFRFLRYSMYKKPHYVLAIAIGVSGPVVGLVATPLRRKYLYPDSEQIPASYPLPNRPREKLTGYDDE